MAKAGWTKPSGGDVDTSSDGDAPHRMSPTLNQPLLNFDTLTYAMSHIESKGNLLPLMMTCRFLYTAGIPHLLRSSVVLSSLSACRSFCAFMLADTNETSRFQNLCRLRLEVNLDLFVAEAICHIADDLAEVLSRSHRLQYLFLQSCDGLLNAYSLSRTALLELPALREFDIREIWQSTVVLLMTMHMPLTFLGLDFDADVYFDPPYPFDLLQNFSATLNKVSLSYVAIGDTTVCCPNVHTLSIDAPHVHDGFLVEGLLLTFPNLTRFTLRVDDYDYDYAAEDQREENKKVLRKHQSSWSNLDFLGGTLPALHTLGLESSVRYLDIDVVDASDITTFRQLFEDLRPTCLDIDLNIRKWTPPELDEALSGIFQLTSVSHLVVSLVLGPKLSADHPQVMHHFITHIREFESESPVTFLALHLLRGPRMKRPHTVVQSEGSSEFAGAKYSLEIAKAAPALSHLYLTYGNQHLSFWSIQRDEAGLVVLESQPEEIGFQMMNVARK